MHVFKYLTECLGKCDIVGNSETVLLPFFSLPLHDCRLWDLEILGSCSKNIIVNRNLRSEFDI